MAIDTGGSSFPSFKSVCCVCVLVAVVLVLLCRVHHTFKYYIKLYLYYSISMFLGLLTTLYALPRPFYPDNNRVLHWGTRFLSMPLLGVKASIRGREFIDVDKPCIIVINHQSSLDMLPLFRFLPNNAVGFAKKTVLYAGPFGLAAWLCGTIFVERSNSAKARQSVAAACELIRNKRRKVVIFPEGTRNHEPDLLPFKKGAFHLAIQAQVPIIPMVFSTFSHFYNKKERRFDTGEVLVEVLPPIQVSGLTADEVNSLTEKTRDQMVECYKTLNIRIAASQQN